MVVNRKTLPAIFSNMIEYKIVQVIEGLSPIITVAEPTNMTSIECNFKETIPCFLLDVSSEVSRVCWITIQHTYLPLQCQMVDSDIYCNKKLLQPKLREKLINLFKLSFCCITNFIYGL